MKWRWLFLDYVDPQLSLSREARREVRRRARAVRRSLRPIDVLGALIPGLVMGVVLVPWFIFLPRSPWFVLLLAFVQLTVSWVLVTLVGRIAWKPRVNAALRELGYDVCSRCGYWLRGLNDDVGHCPECGSERDLMNVEVKHSPGTP